MLTMTDIRHPGVRHYFDLSLVSLYPCSLSSPSISIRTIDSHALPTASSPHHILDIPPGIPKPEAREAVGCTHPPNMANGILGLHPYSPGTVTRLPCVPSMSLIPRSKQRANHLHVELPGRRQTHRTKVMHKTARRSSSAFRPIL